MKKNKISLFLLSIFFIQLQSYAQKINITISDKANMPYIIVLNKGLKQDTIQSGILNIVGNAVVNIPEKYKDFVGIAGILVQGQHLAHTIINNEIFSFNYNGGDVIVKNSPENKCLYSYLKLGEHPKADEKNLYAAKFVELIEYYKQLNFKLQGGGADLSTNYRLRTYANSTLDYEALYTSSLWYHVINGLLQSYPNQSDFGNMMVSGLKRVESQAVFEALADDLLTITTEFGLDDAFDIIIPYVKESGRIETPQGNMYSAFVLSKMRRGMPAVDLEGLSLPLKNDQYKKTILFFFESNCPNCLKEVENLINAYPILKAEKIRVISISIDYEKELYQQTLVRLPWADKLCDFKGFTGTNVSSYGIVGTPTFFLLDENQVILSRNVSYAKLKLDDSL